MHCAKLTILLLCALVCAAPIVSAELTAAASSAPQAAAGTNPETIAREAAPGVPDLPVLRVLGGLGLVLGVIAIGFVAVQRLAPRRFLGSASTEGLKLVQNLSLGDKRSLALIEVEETRLLIGSTPHEVSLLTSFTKRGPGHSEPRQGPATSPARPADAFRRLYEVEKTGRGKPKVLPPDVQAKMRQLREALER